MTLTLPESQAINEIAGLLYEFLPAKPHPYADPSISFPGVAQQVGLGLYWPKAGSKRPSITSLLDLTLQYQRGMFCDLILEIVRKGMIYRNSKHSPITRQEIDQLNELMKKVNFKIPDLWNPAFLDSLPSSHPTPPVQQQPTTTLVHLQNELMRISKLSPQERGYEFEKFLKELFAFYNLAPRGAFKLVGEQIDGSFQIGTDVYLLEAKWQQKPIDQGELLIFHGKVDGKAAWSRGLFVSISGFTEDGLVAFSHGRSTTIIGMSGEDLYFIMKGDMSLIDAINRKARWAAETGQFYKSVFELAKGI